MDTEITYRELWLSFPHGLAYHLRCECLVWTSHHEHARFDINEPIHPATKIVWFQIRNAMDVLLVSIYERTSEGWLHISTRRGELTYTNNNPFCPVRKHQENASFKNWAFSVFPQNQHLIPGTDETLETVWQCDFSEWQVYPPIPGITLPSVLPKLL